MRLTISLALAASLAVLTVGGAAGAQQGQGPMLDFQRGPATFSINGDLAEIDLSDSFLFLDARNSQRLMELNQNPVSGTEAATVVPIPEEGAWFLIFEWDPMGYVEDAEADLDADAILESIRQGTAAANKEREKRGWSTMQILGWQEQPSYDPETNNLTWAIIGESEGVRNINYIVKLLGRDGVMTATLVASPEELPIASAHTKHLLTKQFAFQSGHTYAEFVPGKDKLAEIGLAALIVGGAGAALVKSGLLARFWKVILVGLAAVGTAVRRFFTGTRAEEQPISQV